MLKVHNVQVGLALLVLFLTAHAVEAAEFKFEKGFTNYQRTYSTVKATRHGNVCVLSGLAKTTSGKPPAKATVVGRLSTDCRPYAPLILETNNHTDRARINVWPDGRVEWASGFNYHWVSMDGVTFAVGKTAKGLPLQKGWSNYRGWQGAAWYRQGKQCFLSGLIRPSGTVKLPATVATLPSECRPSHRLVFRQQNARVDVYPTGQVQLWNGRVGSWVSLSGIEYHAGKTGGSLQFLNGWRNYSRTYKAASYYVDSNGICTLSGLIRGSDYRGMVMLPSNCRPKERLLMNVQAASDGHTRVDIMPSGELRWIRGGKGGWVSLSGLVVPTQPKPAVAPAPTQPVITAANGIVASHPNAAVRRAKYLCGFSQVAQSACIDLAVLEQTFESSKQDFSAYLSGREVLASLDSSTNAVHECMGSLIPVQVPDQAFSGGSSAQSSLSGGTVQAGLFSDPFTHSGVLNACAQRAIKATGSALSQGNLLPSSSGTAQVGNFIQAVNDQVGQVCSTRNQSYVYGKGTASVSLGLVDTVLSGLQSLSAIFTKETEADDQTTGLATDYEYTSKSFVMVRDSKVMDVWKGTYTERTASGAVITLTAQQVKSTDGTVSSAKRTCTKTTAQGTTNCDQNDKEVINARENFDAKVRATFRTDNADEDDAGAETEEERQTEEGAESCDPDAGCTDMCQYAQTWWAATQIRCGSSGWQDSYCQKLISIQQGCPDRGLIMPTPDGGEVACAFPTSSNDQQMSEVQCEAQNGISYCTDSGCFCRTAGLIELNREILPETDPCNDPAAECLPDDGGTPEGGGAPPPPPPPSG